MMHTAGVLIELLVLACTELTQSAGVSHCSNSKYLKSEFGSITKPLFPDDSTPDSVGMRSCWYFEHSLEEDYIVGVELKSINVGATRINTLWFSDYRSIFRTKESPYCFLYIRANNTCSRSQAESAMNYFMPQCIGHTTVIAAKFLPAFVVLTSNVIRPWKNGKMNLHVDYRFLPCGRPTIAPGIPQRPIGGNNPPPGLPPAGVPVPPGTQPCPNNANFNKLTQNSSSDLMPVVTALAVLLGVVTIMLIVVILKLRKLRRRMKEQQYTSKILSNNGTELNPSEYRQLQVQVHS